jgi:WD40 repeat protein
MTGNLRELLDGTAGSADVPPVDLGPVLAEGDRVVRRRRVGVVAALAAVVLAIVLVPWTIAGMDTRTSDPIQTPRCESPWLALEMRPTGELPGLTAVSAELTDSAWLRMRGTGDPSFAPDGTQVAFVEYGPGEVAGASTQSTITVIDADGGNLRTLTDGRRLETDPAWSPDGQRIAYVSTRWDDNRSEWSPNQLRIVDVDGTGGRALPVSMEETVAVAWLDDDTLLYEADDSLWRSDVDTPRGPARTAVSTSAGQPWRLSPDTETVATYEPLPQAPSQYRPVVIDLDTGRARSLPLEPVERWHPGSILGWSRDGDLLISREVRDPTAQPGDSAWMLEIWAVSDGGRGDARRIRQLATSDDSTVWPELVNPRCGTPG